MVLAVGRNGERLEGKIGDIRLRAGDTLLLEAHPEFVQRQRSSRDFYLVSDIPGSTPLNHEKAPIAFVILGIMVLLASFGGPFGITMLQAATVAAVAMVVAGCCGVNRALASIEWSVLLVIAAAFGLGKALDSTGAAAAIASTFISVVGDNPWIALAVVYVTTAITTEVITNNAAAALIFPIAITVAKSLDVSIMPFVIVVMMAASASFSTPIGYQTNLMVYGPGGYKFTDYARIGIPLTLIFGLVSVILAPRFYPF